MTCIIENNTKISNRKAVISGISILALFYSIGHFSIPFQNTYERHDMVYGLILDRPSARA